MLSKEEIDRINKILSCDNCPTSYACEGCDITQNDKLLIKKYIASLKQEIDEMADSFYRLYQKIPGTMHKFFENGQPCKYGYDKENNECKEINCKPCLKQYFEKKVNMKEDKEKCKKCNFSMFCDGENCEETINNLGGAVVLGNFYNESEEK